MNLNKMINLKTIVAGVALAAFTTGFTSCTQVPNSPGYEFMPDMYRSRSLEYYGEYVNENGDTLLSGRLPVAGTIARGHLPSIPKGMTYEESVSLKNPIPNSPEIEKEGEVIYGKFCVHCHGDAGKGDGKVAGKLPGPPPAYDGALKNLAEGKIYYSISNGKGSMGPHALMLSAEERWKLVHYVQKLQGPKVIAADSTAATAVAAPKAEHAPKAGNGH